ncbi:MAG: radical SAM protein [Marinicella sp.]
MPAQVEVKSVLNKTRRTDPWFLDDYTVNLYSGCAFNCLYCYIQGSKYGHHVAKTTTLKTNAIEVLSRQLRARAQKKQYGVIVLSSVTDPYMPVDRKYKMTRQALEVILENRFPVHIITKSDLIARDYDLLHAIDTQAIIPSHLSDRLDRGVIISYSFSTLDQHVAHIFEPGAPEPQRRLASLQKTLAEDFYAGISLMPLLPHISDTGDHLDFLFSTFREFQVCYVLPASLTLYGEQLEDNKHQVLSAVQQHFPQLHQKYLKFFSHNAQMPGYYRVALARKTRELCRINGLENCINTLQSNN